MADPTVPNPVVPPMPPGPSGQAMPPMPTASPMPPASYMSSVPPVPPLPPAKRGLSLKSPVVVGIAGLVVGALAAGVPLALTGSSNALGAEKGSLNAPAAIGGFTPMAQNPKADPATVKRLNDVAPISAKNLSAA